MHVDHKQISKGISIIEGSVGEGVHMHVCVCVFVVVLASVQECLVSCVV